jgi:transcriptional regulator with XRE-family HTH domain
MSDLGTRIKNLRKSKGVKQGDLAAKSGISRTFLSDVERGLKTMSMKTAYALSAALEVDISYLLNSDESGILSPKDAENLLVDLQSSELVKSIMAIGNLINSNPELSKIFIFLDEYERDLDRLFDEHRAFYSEQLSKMYLKVDRGLNAVNVLNENSEELKIIKEYYNVVKNYNLKEIINARNVGYAFIKQYVKSSSDQK